jgi:4-diphosphocytidyl-2-C-methyl-D-erythritol kinase
VRLADIITLEKTTDEIAITCSHPAVPEDKTNIAHLAARFFLNKIDASTGWHITIAKRIPVAAGLGGGSSNAAAVLKGLNQYYRKPLSDPELHTLATSIGADVPFFLIGKAAWAQGIGDQLTPVDDIPSLPVILVNPGTPLSTALIYKNLNLRLTKCTQKHKNLSFEKLLSNGGYHLRNDLEPVAAKQCPVIPEIKASLSELGATGTLMSGSGSTVFGIFEKISTARHAFDQLVDMQAGSVFLTHLCGSP